MSDTTSSPPTTPTITIYQLQRDDNAVVVYDEHPINQEIPVDPESYLVELSSPLFHALLSAKSMVGEVALSHVLRSLGDNELQKIEIQVTKKPETLVVRPVRRS